MIIVFILNNIFREKNKNYDKMLLKYKTFIKFPNNKHIPCLYYLFNEQNYKKIDIIRTL